MYPQQWVQLAWLAPASWASKHLIAGLSSVEWVFLIMGKEKHTVHYPHKRLDHDCFSHLKVLVSTFGCVSVFKGTGNLPDAVLRADAIGPHIPSFYNLCCYDVSISCFCGHKHVNTVTHSRSHLRNWSRTNLCINWRRELQKISSFDVLMPPKFFIGKINTCS